jgi:ATP-dependent helicase HrpB
MNRLPAGVDELTISSQLSSIVEAVRTQRTAIIVAPPGAGKTTAVPLALLAGGLADDGSRHRQILLLEPRRLAARAAARRMASLLGQPVGQVVGYRTRDESVVSEQTRICVLTEGVLTRQLQSDASLEHVAAVIFDEVHERNLPTDLGLALLLEARALLRPDIAIVAMSATPDIAALKRVLPDAAVIESSGRSYPVEMHWLPIERGARIEQAVAAAVNRALREQHGDVLTFLPGIAEIRRVEALLRPGVPADVDVYALAGALSTSEQDQALARSPAGRRRVVLSTDIAESSLTVDGVRVVVDAGLARVPRFDPRTGMSRLSTVATSRASAEQRAGRAGRTEPGACYRLWSKIEHSTRLAQLPAEILVSDLAGLALEVAAWGTAADGLPFIDAPPVKTMRAADALLERLGAFNNGAITDLGRRMVPVPLHPRLAAMVCRAADHGDGAIACVLAAVLDERDVLRGRPDELPADVIIRVDAITHQRRHPAADDRDVRRARDRAVDIARRAGVQLDLDLVRSERVGLVLGYAFPDRLAVNRDRGATKRSRQPGQFILRGGSGGFVASDDTLAGEDFLIAADVDGQRSGTRVRIAAALDALDVARLFADEVESRESLEFERQRNDLVMRSELRLGSLVLDATVTSPLAGADTVAAIVQHLRSSQFSALAWTDEAEQLRARVERARSATHANPNGWPAVDDRSLAATTAEWLEPYLLSATGVADAVALDTSLLIGALLTWDQRQHLDEVLPTHLTTPAGRSSAIDYRRDRPTARVRVQDLFGVRTHPTLGDGTPIVLELLSPADRPIQTTADLPGFWAGSWVEVRKEMAGRYPKHQWPTDPANAEPTRLKQRPPKG